MLEPTDTELMLRACADDLEAFHQLTLRYREPLRRFLAALLGDATLAEDCVQETFLRLWFLRKSYMPTGKFSTYLFQIGKHHAFNQQKKVRPCAFPEEDTAEAYLQGSPDMQPEIVVIRRDRRARIRRAIAALPEHYRIVFEMSQFEGLRCAELRNLESAEIATELALSRCLVLTQLHVSSALLAPQRLREIGIVPFLIAQCLGGAIGQRLVRKICPHCAREYQPNEEDLEKIGLSALEDGPFHRGFGCDACMQTGYLGRIGLFEVWEVDNEARRLIAEGAPVEALWEVTFGRTGGSLWDDARAKVQQGITTVEEAAWALFDYPIPARNVLTIPVSPFDL